MSHWAHLSPQPKWHFKRFSHFCTAHGRVSSGMPRHILFPKNYPCTWADLDRHLVHGSLGSPKSNPNWHLDWFSCFCTAHHKLSLYFTMVCPFPHQNCHFPWGIWTPIEHMVPWSHPSPQPKWQLGRFSRFCGAHYLDRPTDRPHYSVCNNRPDLASAVIRPNNNNNNNNNN